MHQSRLDAVEDGAHDAVASLAVEAECVLRRDVHLLRE